MLFALSHSWLNRREQQVLFPTVTVFQVCVNVQNVCNVEQQSDRMRDKKRMAIDKKEK